MPMLEYLQKRGASGLRVLAPALSETEPKHWYFLGDVGSYTTLGPLGCKDSSSLTSGIPKKTTSSNFHNSWDFRDFFCGKTTVWGSVNF